MDQGVASSENAEGRHFTMKKRGARGGGGGRQYEVKGSITLKLGRGASALDERGEEVQQGGIPTYLGEADSDGRSLGLRMEGKDQI